jgi:AraC-like DNA-binding protein
MPRPPSPANGARIWRVESLRNLELVHARAMPPVATHVHPAFEIAVVERGAIRIGCAGTTRIAPAGALVVIPPGEVHTQACVTAECRVRSFFPDLESLVQASSSGFTGAPSFRESVIADGSLARQIMRLHRMLGRPGSVLARETAAVLAATALVTRHAKPPRPAADPAGRDAAMVRRARAFLHDRLDANVSLSELAGLFGVAAHTLVRAFTAAVGMPPHSYHLQIRVNRAKTLLSRGGSPSRVAAETGFVDQSHLIRHFRRCVGVTPGAYAAAVIG